MAKTPVKENRDIRVKELRLEIRISKSEKDELRKLAEQKKTSLSKLIIDTLLPPKG